MIIKSKLYYWTEEDKINLCFNLSQVIDPDTELEDVEFKKNEQPAIFERKMTFRAKDIAKEFKDTFWFLETVRCPMKKKSFYVHESVRRNCYFVLASGKLTNGQIHIKDEFCDVNVLNSAV